MFIAETRKENGDKYPPATICALLSGINRTLQEKKVPFSIFDKQSPAFCNLWKTLDIISSTLHREGVGANKKHAAVIEVDHEQVYWDKGLLGYSSPRILQKTVFFYTGLHYALRGVEEQHSLVPEQLSDILLKVVCTTPMFTMNILNLFQKITSIAIRISVV